MDEINNKVEIYNEIKNNPEYLNKIIFEHKKIKALTKGEQSEFLIKMFPFYKQNEIALSKSFDVIEDLLNDADENDIRINYLTDELKEFKEIDEKKIEELINEQKIDSVCFNNKERQLAKINQSNNPLENRKEGLMKRYIQNKERKKKYINQQK